MTREWQAEWVWAPGEVPDTDSYTWFRAEIDLPVVSSDTLLHISADQRYRLWVNGVLVGDGPPPSVPEEVYYDTHDITDLLRPGRNCLAVVARDVALTPGRRPGFLAELVDPSGTLLATTGGGAWRCRPATAWTFGAVHSTMNLFDPSQEIFDARREPEGWRRAGFDDADWMPVERIGAADRPLESGQWAAVLARPIPAMEVAPVRPVQITVDECLWLATRTRPDLSIALSQAGRPLSAARADGSEQLIDGHGPAVLASSAATPSIDGVYDPCLLLDFGREETAFVELDLEGAAGAIIDAGVAERLIDGHFNNAIEGQFCARYILREGRQVWRSSAWRGFRYLRLRVRAARPVTVHAVYAVRSRYPFVEAGGFAATPRLTAIFEMCRATVRLCSHESIMDTPWREQAQWLGDISAVTAPAIRTAFGDTALVDKFIRQAARTVSEQGTLANISNAAPKPGARAAHDIPDYTLWWVIDLLEHYRFSGDLELVREMFPVVRQILAGFARHHTPHGTLAGFGWVFIDWADVDTEGECAALNAIYLGALQAAAGLASIMDAAEDRARWTQTADRLRAVFHDRFWSEPAGAFVDAVHEDGLRSSRISEHANFAAIRFGLVSGAPAEALATRILADRGVVEAQPFFTSVIVDALRRLGRVDLALEVIEDRWGTRMLDRGATSCFEEWGINGSWRNGTYAGFLRTTSHAWSAHPASFLITALAGIDILEPGCGRLQVDPYLGLDYIARFPTPLGAVTVRVADGAASVEASPGVAVVTPGAAT